MKRPRFRDLKRPRLEGLWVPVVGDALALGAGLAFGIYGLIGRHWLLAEVAGMLFCTGITLLGTIGRLRLATSAKVEVEAEAGKVIRQVQDLRRNAWLS